MKKLKEICALKFIDLMYCLSYFKKGIIYIIIILFHINNLVAQRDTIDFKPVMGLSIRSGIVTYFGDLNNRGIKFTNNNKNNYGLGINLKWKCLSGSLNVDVNNYGQILNTKNEHKSFKANGNMFGFEVNYWPIIKKNYGLFIGTGLSYLKNKIFTDTLDVNGNKYNYWTDGTIRDQPEAYNNIFTSNKIKKDNVFESSIGQTKDFIYPLRAGIMIRFIKDIQISYASTFYITNKNNIDGNINTKKKDYLMYNTLSLIWYFNSYDKVDQGIYKKVNFKDLWDADEDNDGVNDVKDKCFGTKKGVKVDKYGCPFDTDNDGIDDNKDKEKNTEKKLLTDLDGIGQEPGVPEVSNDNSQDIPLIEPEP